MSRSAPTYDNVRAPPGYIAGRGRGAVGFQTRSDIGNASADKPKEASLDNSQFDNFSGYSGSIVSQEYDREDEDADKIYEAIDQRMQARRKRKRDEDDSKVCLLVILFFHLPPSPSTSLHIPPPPSPPFLSILTQPNLSVSHLY